MTEENVNEKALSTDLREPMGFEDEETGDLIIPRIKVIQALSPERKEKIAEEGDILNSLTKEKINGRTFVPVFKFNNNIWWKERADGGGIKCMARDGKNGIPTDGSAHLICAACKKNEFDNSKTGKESYPVCTKYINFFGFIVGSPIPIVLSFAKTNYGEGKKLFSLAKVTMQNMWNFGYRLDEKKMSKGGNDWFIINTTVVGPTTEEERKYAHDIYQSFRNAELKFDMEEAATNETEPSKPEATEEEINKAEY